MTEEKKSPSVEEVLKQIDDFENTISQLKKNVEVLRQKLQKNKEQYGSNIANWPKGKAA